jgi:hypothetical protein
MQRTSTFLKLFLLIAPLLGSSTLSAALDHSYEFTPTNLGTDQTGSLDLTEGSRTGNFGTGTSIDYSPTGILSISDDNNDDPFLSAEAGITSDYTVSFFFRFSTAQDNFTGLLSSDDSTSSAYQVDVNGGEIRLNGVGGTTIIASSAEATLNDWHLVTVTKDSDNGHFVWFDGKPGFSLSAAPSDLVTLTLGSNRNRDRSFIGDLADLRIFDGDTVWTDALQSSVLAAGPYTAVPEPSAFALLTGSLGLAGIGLRRNRSRRS